MVFYNTNSYSMGEHAHFLLVKNIYWYDIFEGNREQSKQELKLLFVTQQSHFWEFILELYLQISEEICIQECPWVIGCSNNNNKNYNINI